MKTLLFDLDGTLVNSMPMWERALHGTLTGRGASVEVEQLRDWFSVGRHMEHWIGEIGLDPALLDIIRQERDTMYMDLLSAHATWMEDAVSLLGDGRFRGPSGIVTNSLHKYIGAMKKRVPLSDHFATIVTVEDADHRGKPLPDPLLLAAEKIGVLPENCVYVGDQTFDMMAAKAAGMTGILVERPFTTKEALPLADHVIPSLEALLDLVD